MSMAIAITTSNSEVLSSPCVLVDDELREYFSLMDESFVLYKISEMDPYSDYTLSSKDCGCLLHELKLLKANIGNSRAIA